MHLYKHTFTHEHPYTYKYTYICTYTCMNVHTLIYIYIYISQHVDLSNIKLSVIQRVYAEISDFIIIHSRDLVYTQHNYGLTKVLCIILVSQNNPVLMLS